MSNNFCWWSLEKDLRRKQEIPTDYYYLRNSLPDSRIPNTKWQRCEITGPLLWSYFQKQTTGKKLKCPPEEKHMDKIWNISTVATT